jgi:hypothetical protein
MNQQPGIQQQRYFETTRNFRCPNCGGELQVFNKRTRYVGCTYCGAELDAHAPDSVALLRLNDPPDFPPFSFVRLGLEGTFDGVKHVVVGRTRWHSFYEEYWRETDEDGEVEEGYEATEWVYDEWVLLSENRNLFYLIEDAEGFAVARQLVPKTPVLPTGKYDRLHVMGDSPKRILEYGNSVVAYHEGESTYQVLRGERSFFAMYNQGQGLEHIVEWRKAANGATEEIEFFIEGNIPPREVARAFNVPESEAQRFYPNASNRVTAMSGPEAVAKALAKARFWQFAGICMTVTGIVFLVLLFRTFGSDAVLTEQVFQANIAAIDLPNLPTGAAPTRDDFHAEVTRLRAGPDQKEPVPSGYDKETPAANYATEPEPPAASAAPAATSDGSASDGNASTVATEPTAEDDRFTTIGYMAFAIEDLHKVYRLTVETDLPDQSEVFIGTEVVDADSIPNRVIEGDFYRASGTEYECDEDGCGDYAWSEADLSTSFLFRPDTVGIYHVRVFGAAPQPVQCVVRVALEQTSVWYYYGIGTFGFLLLGLPIWMANRSRIRSLNQFQY